MYILIYPWHKMIASKLDFSMVSIVEGSFEGIFEYLNTKYINLQN